MTEKSLFFILVGCLYVFRLSSVACRFSFLVVGLLVLSSCASRVEHHPLPIDLAQQTPDPFMGLRFYGDQAPPGIDEKMTERVAELKARFQKEQTQGIDSAIYMLTLSGGSEDGAFGAGFLEGWSNLGTRPVFDIVTGISTGGLIAPFAFLGSEHDVTLREVYTTTHRKDVFKSCVLCGVFGAAFSNTKPLRQLIAKHMTREIFEAIGAEHRKGRRLWVGTTNLDNGRPVIWDIGALANSGRSDAYSLFQQIMLATSSIPGLFPPVAISLGDGRHTELHADGGIAFVTFLYPPEITPRQALAEAGINVPRKLYVVLNTRLPPYYEATRPSSFAILKRALHVTVQYKADGDALHIYEIAKRDGLDFHMVMIPESFRQKPKEDFDSDYMKALFETGVSQAQVSNPWLTAPPGFEKTDP